MPTLGLVTIGQAPRDDLVPEMLPLMPPTTIVQAGALDVLTADELTALAPATGEDPLTSRLADGTSVVFGHAQVMPLVQTAVRRVESDGADVILVACSGSFPALPHTVPLLFEETLAHHAAAALTTGLRVGIIRPLPDQITDGLLRWEADLGAPVATAAAASPYIDGGAAVAARIADQCDVVILDCIGYDEPMRAAAAQASDRPVFLVRTLVTRLLGELLL